MCSRFSTDFPPEELASLAKEGQRLRQWQPRRGDAFPGTEQLVLVHRKERLRTAMFWGWQRSWTSRPLINCRMEKAAPGGRWHAALARNRCLVPVSSWWEWEHRRGKALPWRFFSGKGLLFLGGIYEVVEGCPRFSLLTRPGRKEFLFVHSRMPLVFDIPQGLEWLAPQNSPQDVLERAWNAGPEVLFKRDTPPPGKRGRQKELFLPGEEEEEEHAPQKHHL